MKVVPTHLESRFWAKVAVPAPGGCAEWLGAKNNKGYGQFRYNGKLGLAHRFACELANGPAVGKVARHDCDNPGCVAGYHLRWGTQSDNLKDSVARDRLNPHNARKTHCSNGHEFTSENTYVFTGRGRVERQCRTCVRAANRRTA